LFDERALRRLAFIRHARELGFPLEEVRAMLRLSEDRAQPCPDVKQIAIGHLAEVRSKIADLRAMGAALEILIATRAMQGLGAAIVSPAALSIITTTFAEGAERNRALGIWGAVAGAGTCAQQVHFACCLQNDTAPYACASAADRAQCHA